jgi:hypothetical protein
MVLSQRRESAGKNSFWEIVESAPILVDKNYLWDKIQSARKKAEVAELADALRSGRSEGSLMWVQVPPSAHRRLAVQAGFLFNRWACSGACFMN